MRPRGNPLVRFRVPPEAIAAIEARPEYRPESDGRTGGVGAWVRELVMRELGLEAPLDIHAEQAAKFAARRK